MTARSILSSLLCVAAVATSSPARQNLDDLVSKELPSLVSTYKNLHAHPELSYYEKNTSEFVARELRTSGFEVTERVGTYGKQGLTSYGVVGVLRNGSGPAVLVRTDLDALPVEEKTGLPYASTKRAKNDAGVDVAVMHACGHDIHMTTFLGTAKMLTQLKTSWHGTLVMIGQPAEERGGGAKAMVKDGLFARFPKPDYALALHDNATLEAGKVGVCPGYALANVTSVDITIRGVGGHGAYPHATKDPIVIASEVVMQLQTIVSRENNPLDPAVVTVGSIHGGTKHNIIPDDVQLQITVRSYKEEVRKRILSSIERIARNVALAGGVPADRLPIVSIDEGEHNPSTYNDPELTKRLTSTFHKVLGKENVVEIDPVMGAEDFSFYGIEGKMPACLFWLGAVDPVKVAQSKKEGTTLPSLHSSQFAPLPEMTIRTGVKAMTSAVLELMKK